MGKTNKSPAVFPTQEKNKKTKTSGKKARNSTKRKFVSPDYQISDKKSRLTSESDYESDTTDNTDNDSLCELVTINSKATTPAAFSRNSSMSVTPTHTEIMDSTLTNLSTTHHQSPSVSCGSPPQQNQTHAGDQQTYVLSQLRHTPPYMVTPPMLQSTPVQGHYMPQPVLTDMDIRIINSLRISLREEIQFMVQAVVQEQVQPLRHEITDLRQSVSILSNKVAFLEHELDNTNQYSRRHCVLVSNVPETPDEDTNQIICDIAKQGGANIKESDIDRSHRNGPPKKRIENAET